MIVSSGRLAVPRAAAALLLLSALLPAERVRAEEKLPEVLVTRQLLAARRLQVGDVVRLAAHADGRGARPFRIVGVYEPTPDPMRLAAERHEVRLHLPDHLDLVADPDDPLGAESVTAINIAVRAPGDVRALEREIPARLPDALVIPARAPRGNDPFVVLERFHVAISLVTVLGGTAFLLALMVMRAEERREVAGVLRLVGFTRRRVLVQVMLEGMAMAVGGALFGVALAVVAQHAFNAFFQWRYDTALVFVRVTAGIAAKCVALAVPLGVAAGVAASWALLRRPVLDLLRR